MNKFKFILFAASFALAMAFTISCSSDDGGDDSGGDGGKGKSVEHEGRSYKTVKIGSQTWMAENLNLETPDGSWCHSNNQENCVTYGRLYDWATAMGFEESCNINSCKSQIQTPHQGICPEGWHLPSIDEWMTLVTYIGSYTAGTKLKSETVWSSSFSGIIKGTDDYGFSALPGGYRGSSRGGDGFGGASLDGNWWSATEFPNYRADYITMVSYTETVYNLFDNKSRGFSVRCVKD